MSNKDKKKNTLLDAFLQDSKSGPQHHKTNNEGSKTTDSSVKVSEAPKVEKKTSSTVSSSKTAPKKRGRRPKPKVESSSSVNELTTIGVSKRAKNIIKMLAAREGITIREFVEGYAEDLYEGNKDYIDETVKNIMSQKNSLI